MIRVPVTRQFAFCQNEPNSDFYQHFLNTAEKRFWRCAETGDDPLGASAMEASAGTLPIWKA